MCVGNHFLSILLEFQDRRKELHSEFQLPKWKILKLFFPYLTWLSQKCEKINIFPKKLQIVSEYLEILGQTPAAAPKTPQRVLAITFSEFPKSSGTARVNVNLGAFPPFSWIFSQRQQFPENGNKSQIFFNVTLIYYRNPSGRPWTSLIRDSCTFKRIFLEFGGRPDHFWFLGWFDLFF